MNADPYKLSFAKLSSSRTGLVSPCPTSTSVTPITPMTPLTTPRTPAQILLLGRKDKPQDKPRPDTAMEHQALHQQKLALDMFTNFVDSVECSLLEIAEREVGGERVIESGIVRMCADLAERVEELAEEWKERDTAVYDLLLKEEGDNDEQVALSNDAPASGTMHSLLSDTAASLRSITPREAQELAEVSLQVAIMAVWTLRVIQRNMSRMLHASENVETYNKGVDKHLKNDSSTSRQLRVTWSNDDDTIVAANRNKGSDKGLGPLVEILGEEEKKDEYYIHNGASVNVVGNGSCTPLKEFPPRYTPQLATIPSSPSIPTSNHPIITHPTRRRVLWPPLLPTIQHATQSCLHSAQEHPLPAVAVGLVCGPAALTTAVLVGPPLLITDWAVQSSYNAMSHTPFIENVEKAAAHAFQVSRLAILCSKLAIKEGVSVGERQIQRRGGVVKICCDVVDGAVDGVMHPVETVGRTWEGLVWMGSVVRDAVGFVGDVVSGGGELRMDIH